MDKSKRLGRGLSSLLAAPPSSASHAIAPSTAEPGPVIEAKPELMIPIGDISPNPFQPRRTMDDEGLKTLAASIAQAGVMQPILVRRKDSGGSGGYELIAGERRWRAAQLVGLKEIPALVRPLADRESAEWAIVENIQREDLNVMDRAYALRSLCEQFGLSQGQAAERVGLDRSSVANLIRLTELEPEIAALIATGRLGGGHGKALLSLAAGELRAETARRAAAEEWSVRRLEQVVRGVQEPKEAKAPTAASLPTEARQAVLVDLERQLSQFLGTKVHIMADATGQRGKLVVEFYGIDHFDGLLAKIGIR